MNLEVFPCSGGMGEGFRRAGITFDIAIDKDPHAVASYERNHGHRPLQMDVNDFAKMVRAGWRPAKQIDFFLADPPCTPHSRAGKRLGLEDERDCMVVTAELITLLRPRAYLIGNVPGLQDSTSWHIVQDVIGGLAAHGYCVVDYAALDAADYGVPQHRVRPFWFGHLDGPCIKWPARTHFRPELVGQYTLGEAFARKLLPWVTCRQALGHLPLEELGRPVRMRIRDKGEDGTRHGGDRARCSTPDLPAKTVVAKADRKGGQILIPAKHPALDADEPSTTVRSGGAGHAAPALVLAAGERTAGDGQGQRVMDFDEPSSTIIAAGRGAQAILGMTRKAPWIPSGGDKSLCSEPDRPAKVIGAHEGVKGGQVLMANEKHPMCRLDEPAMTVTSHLGATGAIQGGSALFVGEAVEHQHHRASDPDQPSYVIKTGGGRASRNGSTMRLPELERDPSRGANYSTPDEPAMTITRNTHSEGATLVAQPRRGQRLGAPDRPGDVVTTDPARVGAGPGQTLTWPWDRPATTILGDERLSVPGHHDAGVANSSHKGPNAVVLSARAAAILQGFPDGECTGMAGRCVEAGCRPGEVCPICGDVRRWHFTGATKKAIWSQLGQAMPPALAHAVAQSVAEQMRAERAA